MTLFIIFRLGTQEDIISTYITYSNFALVFISAAWMSTEPLLLSRYDRANKDSVSQPKFIELTLWNELKMKGEPILSIKNFIPQL